MPHAQNKGDELEVVKLVQAARIERQRPNMGTAELLQATPNVYIIKDANDLEETATFLAHLASNGWQIIQLIDLSDGLLVLVSTK